jgi:molybdenum cofactor biosynthesis enzyme MoaA
MCNIWRIKNPKELKISEVQKIFESPFFSHIKWISVTGGEPFLHENLPDLIRILGKSLPSLEGVSIPTNGFVSSTSTQVKEILQSIGRQGGCA